MALLDTMGVSLIPPSAAQVPLTFTLKPGSPATLIPCCTLAGTAPGGTLPAVGFETTSDLTVIPAQITQMFTMDPVWDRYTDSSGFAGSLSDPGYMPFVGAARMPHVVTVGHDVLLDFTAAVVDLEPAAPFVANQLAALQALFRSLSWSCVQNGAVQSLTPAGVISTTLLTAAAVSAIRLQLVSTSGMTIGDKLTIGSVAGIIVAVEQGNVVRLSAPIQTPLAAGAVVTVTPSVPVLRLPVGAPVDRTALQGPGLSSAIQGGVTGRWLQGRRFPSLYRFARRARRRTEKCCAACNRRWARA